MNGLTFEGAIDGELLVWRDGAVAPFGDLQQRLNRKTVDAKTMAAFPAAIVAYDLWREAGEDLRGLPLEATAGRGSRRWSRATPASGCTCRRWCDYDSWDALGVLRADPPVGAAAEGLMLKRWDSPYVAGRPKGPWFKWKRDPHTVDCVMMYAQRGHGKRSSFYSDYTFGVWTPEGTLTPVGKAYFGFTDEELKQLDKFVRDHTIERFGPVRSVRAERDFGLVLEIAFEGLHRSPRHKSGRRHALPARQPHPLGQAGAGGQYAGRRHGPAGFARERRGPGRQSALGGLAPRPPRLVDLVSDPAQLQEGDHCHRRGDDGAVISACPAGRRCRRLDHQRQEAPARGEGLDVDVRARRADAGSAAATGPNSDDAGARWRRRRPDLLVGDARWRRPFARPAARSRPAATRRATWVTRSPAVVGSPHIGTQHLQHAEPLTQQVVLGIFGLAEARLLGLDRASCPPTDGQGRTPRIGSAVQLVTQGTSTPTTNVRLFHGLHPRLSRA